MSHALTLFFAGTLVATSTSTAQTTTTETPSSTSQSTIAEPVLSPNEWKAKRRNLWIGWGVFAAVLTVGTVVAIVYRDPVDGTGLGTYYVGVAHAVIGGGGVLGYSIGLGLHSRRKPRLSLAPFQLRVQF